jgi:hypothetical protein
MADDLTTLWANLSLSEGEDNEVEIQVVDVIKIVTCGQSYIVGKLMSERMVCKETIKTKLKRWWKIAGTFTFKVLGENLFLIEFEYAKGKKRVLEGKPWDFEGNLFLVEDFDGRTLPSDIVFNKASFWIRMTNLPLACMGRDVGFKLGSSAGTVEEVDTDADGIGWGEFLRVKILVDLYKPLSRGRMMKFEGKSYLIGFKYEKLPKFCFNCGVICHGPEGYLKWTSKRNEEEFTQFGPWLRANSPTRRDERISDRHGSRHTQMAEAEEWPRRSENFGRRRQSRKREADDADMDELDEGPNRESQTKYSKKAASCKPGANMGSNEGNVHKEKQTVTEGNKVRAMKAQFEFKSTSAKSNGKIFYGRKKSCCHKDTVVNSITYQE